jgi:hypothetical protein
MKTRNIISMLSMSFFATMQIHAQVSEAYVHIADSSNTSFNSTRCDHELLNDSSNANPIIIHRYNVGANYVAYLNKKVGTWYNSTLSKWALYTQDKSAFPTNTAYNVLIPGTDMTTFIHKSNKDNVLGDYTVIDNAAINNNPNAVFLVNDLYKGVYNLKINGVYYHQGTQRWRIFNMDGSDMAENLSFTIVVAKNGQPYGAAYHTTDAQNITSNRTALNIPAINNNPDALVFVTTVWPLSGNKNNHHVGVYYSGGKWYVYNETNGTTQVGFEMPEKVGFNVVYFLNKPQTNINEAKISINQMNVFPNPVQNGEQLSLNINENLGAKVRISLNSIDGKCVYSNEVESHNPETTYNVNISDLAPGVYTLKVESEGKVGLQKVMIK